MKNVIAVLIISLAGCAADPSKALDAFGSANTSEEELKCAHKLNDSHAQIIVRLFDADHKALDTAVAYQAPEKIVFVELQLGKKKVSRKVLNKKSIIALLSE